MDLPAEEGARLVALGRLGEAIRAAQALAKGAGEERLHDFRVAVRRLRSALRAYRPWLEEGIRPKHEKRLKKLGHSTNAARDAEVQLAWLVAERQAFRSERRRPGWELAVARYEARAHAGSDAERVAARFLKLARTLHARLATYERKVDDPGASFGSVLAALARDQADALSERLRAIDGAADRERVHRARIEGKRLRYLVEPLRGYEPADATGAIARLKRLQDILGDLHDAHVLAAELGDALADAAAERARRIYEVACAHGPRAAALRRALQGNPRAGLLSLVALVRERRDALFAELEREWRAGGVDTLSSEVGALAAALEARAGGAPGHRRGLPHAEPPPRGAEDDGAGAPREGTT